MMDYILWCGEEGNFATRSMLIPKELFESNPERARLLQEVRDHSVPRVFHHRDLGDVFIDHWYTLKFEYNLDERGCGSAESRSLELVDTLTSQADWEYPICGHEDWFPESICCLFSGFDHIDTYYHLRHLKKWRGKDINIVEGFLCMEDRKSNPFMKENEEEVVLN
jgi:hypothetical protein